MNREALARTVETRRGASTGRARARKLWRKGESRATCRRCARSASTATATRSLLRVEQVGGIACHTGRERCFFQRLEDGALASTSSPVLKDPKAIYRAMKLTERDILATARRARIAARTRRAIPATSYVARCSQGRRRDPEEDRRGGDRDGDGREGRRPGRIRPRSPTCGSTAWSCWRATAWRPRTCSPSSRAAKARPASPRRPRGVR